MFRRTPVRWPDNARVALTIYVPFDTWPENTSAATLLPQDALRAAAPEPRANRDIAAISDRQYGERVGIYRVLDILRSEGIKASFFVNGRMVEAFPQLMTQIAEAGHELSSENWCRQTVDTTPREDQYGDIRRTVDAFRRKLGLRPQGFLMPADGVTEETPRILVELGYKYWMAFCHEDLPYVLKVGRGEIVVASCGLSMTDPAGAHPEGCRNARALFQAWKDNFDWLYEEGATYPGFMSLGVYPFLIGRPSGAGVFREFLRYASAHSGVWFARGMDVANYWMENCRQHLIEKWPNYGTGLAYEKTMAR